MLRKILNRESLNIRTTSSKENAAATAKSKKPVQNKDNNDISKHLTNIKAILKNSNASMIRNHYGIGYTCGFCQEQYPDPANLKKHSLETHDSVEIANFATARSMCDYVIKLDITSLFCKLCDRQIDTVESLMNHLKIEHEIEIFTDIDNHIIPFKFDSEILACVICENRVEFNKFKSLLEHMTKHYRNYICDACDAGFINSRQLSTHKYVHDTGSYICETCEKVFENERKLKAHVRAVHVVKKLPKYRCGYCNETFIFYHAKEAHLQKVHGVNFLKINCRACDKSFLSRSSYTAHVKFNHMMLRSHECSQCGKRFARACSLKEHEERVHLGLRLYKCDLCIKTFTMRKALVQHMRIHNNDRRYKCKYCGQAFIAKISWRRHMRSKHDEIV
ncbi:uncharacterized protein ACR2FA_008385 [Aphomia sociella]